MAIRSCLVLAVLGVVGSVQPGRAELPPQYIAWQDFAAVAALDEIPGLLGVVDRIEKVEFGRFLVRAGRCSVEVRVARVGAKGRDGSPMPGPSRVAGVTVGDKHCD